MGLIGASYAWSLSDSGYEVGGIDINQHSIDYCLEKGWIKHGTVNPDEEYISQFDIIIFAIYPTAFKEWIKNNQHCIKKNALLTDTTGVKSCIVYDIQDMLRDDLEFIGAHPMAGREKGGVEFADKNIFVKANYIVTPTKKNSDEAIGACKKIGVALGFRNIVELTPEKHDEMIGFLSQLTHCIAVSLMTCRSSEKFAFYTGDSFRDLTRIAKINENMWTELFLLNKNELLEQMDCFEKQFHKLREYIADDDAENIKKILRDSTRQREIFDN